MQVCQESEFAHEDISVSPATRCPSFPPPYLLLHYPLLRLTPTPSPLLPGSVSLVELLHEKPAKDRLNASRV